MKKNLSNKYLSIGEISKIMKVSHTSLRYYDEIGILTPAYINEETGYRYYAKNQIPILSLILLAIELDIPLKELGKYLHGKADIDLEDFVLYAKNKVSNSIKKMQRDLYFLDSAEKHFQENNYNFTTIKPGEEYIKQKNMRYFITLPCNSFENLNDFDISDYWKKMTELYMLIHTFELSASIEQGIMYIKENNEIKVKFFAEIKKIKQKTIKDAEVICIPRGEYLCSFYPDACIQQVADKYLYHSAFENGSFLIISDILEKKVSKKIMPFEVQQLKNKCSE